MKIEKWNPFREFDDWFRDYHRGMLPRRGDNEQGSDRDWLPAVDILGRESGPTGFEKAERAAVIRALARAGNNVSQAARQLGIGRATLYRRMKRLGLSDS